GKGKGKGKRAAAGEEGDEEDKPNWASRIDTAAQEAGIDLFHDSRREPYAAVLEGGGRRVMRLGSEDSRLWLGGLVYRKENAVPPPAALDSAIASMMGRAIHAGQMREVAIRVASHGGNVFLDLGREAVEIGPEGWK